MKDEEMAENWIAEYTGVDVETQKAIQLQYHKNLKQAFLAGLKAKTQWHDLRKDKNDLPKEPTEKMRVNETWVYVKFFDNTYGLVDKGALNNYSGAIAWCELPTFDKEQGRI